MEQHALGIVAEVHSRVEDHDIDLGKLASIADSIASLGVDDVVLEYLLTNICVARRVTLETSRSHLRLV